MGIEEDRFQLALETVTETISEYGEDVIIEAFRLILKEYDYEVVKLDPGPDEDHECEWQTIGYSDQTKRFVDQICSPGCGAQRSVRADEDVQSGNVWPRETIYPVSKSAREHDLDLMERAFPGKLVPFPRRWT